MFLIANRVSRGRGAVAQLHAWLNDQFEQGPARRP